jgi:hypothetical protein
VPHREQRRRRNSPAGSPGHGRISLQGQFLAGRTNRLGLSAHR